MKMKKEFILRNIAGEAVIVPTGSASANMNGMITANGTAETICKCLKNDTTPEEILKTIMDEYDVDEELAQKDVYGFLEALRGMGMLEE